jgi:hypothetical protein
LNITYLGLLHQFLLSQIQIGVRNQTLNKANQKQTFNMKFFATVVVLSLGGVEGKKKKK